MRVLKVLAPLATLALLAATGPALASGDVEAGKKVFNKCKACHDISEGKNKVGPTLKGVMGRTAGTVEGYAYSDAMKASGIVWNEDTLEKYLADPKALVADGKMQFPGLKKEEEIENIIAYIAEASK
jgi:cytochrome c